MTLTIYHNPQCSKSRQTLAMLRENGCDPEIVEYLKTPPSEAELAAILDRLGLEPLDLIRKNEEPYKEHILNDANVNREQLIRLMVSNPILIERPIVVNGEKAAIGRPPETVLAIL